MATIFWVTAISFFFFFFTTRISKSQAQQEYVDKHMSDCYNHFNSTDGNVCNSVNSCQSYLTFKSISPYDTPTSIAYLLNSTPSLIAQANNITDVDLIPHNTMVIVPVNCSCSGPFYQHNATYTLKHPGETYFTVANNTYQALTSCQALQKQNIYDSRNLTVGLKLQVPLRCACPTEKQSANGVRYLLTYLISQGETIDSIAEIFNVDNRSILDANELSTALIFYFTPLSIPLKHEPLKQLPSATPPPQTPPPPAQTPGGNSNSSSSKKWVIVGVTVGVGLFLLFVLSVFFLRFYHRRRQSRSVEEANAKPFSASATDKASKKLSDTTATTTQSWSLSSEGLRYAVESLTVYKFEDLQKATENFGEGNRIKGSVYRASFKGDGAAVKILNRDVSGEINILKRINHTNIIRLCGICVYKGNTYLVYEFAENDSLDDWLHSDEKYQNSRSLNWVRRVQIAHDVADALNYLHNYTNPPHIHKNLNGGNVLLDSNFRAKVSNFGLARVWEEQGEEEQEGFQLTRHIRGTQGYMPPEYIENGVITPKMDVFAFGVVILELLSGREAIGEGKNNGSGEQLLSATVNQVLEGQNVRDKLQAFMDPTLRGEYPLHLAYSMAELAKRCVDRELNLRPDISEVFTTLSKIQSSSLDWDSSDELERSTSTVGQVTDSRLKII